jgi:glycosyltransferase involved in cell wall biosynthesis
MNMVLSPYDGNAYIELMKKAYISAGFIVKPFSIKHLKDIRYVMLNWFESVSLKGLIKRTILLFYLIADNKKIIWTMHNKVPHDIKYKKICKMFMLFLEMVSYKILIHSNETFDLLSFKQKALYVPHPNLIGIYGAYKKGGNIENSTLKILFFGILRPYKNVELLIQAIRELNLPRLILTVCGPAEKKYGQKIIESASGFDNIKIRIEFIPDHEVGQMLADNHLLILPNDLQSSLNSCAIITAFSYHRTVIASMNGTLKDMERQDVFFAYEYSTENEHKEKLRNIIKRIYERYKGNYNDLLALGERCYEMIQKHNNFDETVRKLSKIVEE